MKEISQEVIIRAQEGEISAFEEIYRAASGFVFTLALRIAGNQQDAEEITQDVFLRIHRHLKSFAFRSSIKTWVYRVAVNTAISKYRRMVRERVNKVDFDTVMETRGVEPAQEGMVRDEDNEQRIKAALEGLNPDQRAILLMREVEGLSYEEIARSLRVKINTVRTRLKRAREKMIKNRAGTEVETG